MELLIKIFKQIPPLWPRIALVVVIGLALLFPKGRAVVTRGGRAKRRHERAKRLLELRKLQFDVALLRAKNPEIADSPLDREIGALLAGAVRDEDADEAAPLPWTIRLALAGAGTLVFLVAGALGLSIAGDQTPAQITRIALRELLVLAPSALIASAIPAGARWMPVFYGVLLPVLLTALAVVARNLA